MAFEIIPAIDIRGGKCVRLFQGDYDRETVYGEDPVAMARRWQEEGATRLHVVDLDGARDGVPVNLDLISRLTAAIAIPVQVGGGIRLRETLVRLLDAGVQRGILGSVAAAEPELTAALFQEFGEQVVLGLDAREGRVAVHGWRDSTGRDSVDFALAMEQAGARRIIYTDIARDGTLEGPSLESTRRLAEALEIPVIASGGVGSPGDITAAAALEPVGVEGIIVGRALYTGDVSLRDVLNRDGGN